MAWLSPIRNASARRSNYSEPGLIPFVEHEVQAAGRSGGLSHETIRRFPCLVLIDEWVAYARQLHDQSDLPAGSFETQFTLPLHYERASGSNDRSVACLTATLDCVRRKASLGSRPARTRELIEETALGRRAD